MLPLNGYKLLALWPKIDPDDGLICYHAVVDRGPHYSHNPMWERYVVVECNDPFDVQWNRSIKYTTSLNDALRWLGRYVGFTYPEVSA